MVSKTFIRAAVVNFVTSFIVAIVACYFLLKFDLTDVMYIGSLFGLYFLVVFGIDIMIESGELANNRNRFIFAIVSMIVFDILFLVLIPYIFGPNVFDPVDHIAIDLGSFKFNLDLGIYFFLFVFNVLVLIFNYILFKWDIHHPR